MIPTVVSRPAVTSHSFSVEDYYRMAEVGILSPDDRVELLGGQVVDMSPIGVRHAACVMYLHEFLFKRLHGECKLGVQSPVRLGEHNEPEPDVAVLRSREDRYRKAHPAADDVLLLIEVAESSLTKDRLVKVPLYARFGIPEVWIVDLEAERVEVYREPKEGEYRKRRKIGLDGSVAPEAFPEAKLIVAELFGKEVD